MATVFPYDLVVLDLNLPELDGLSVLKSLRQRKANLPVMILTARSRVEDRVQCLDAGADDDLVSLFRISSCRLARGRCCGAATCRRNRCWCVIFRWIAWSVKWSAGRPIELTTKEFALLEYLIRNAGRRLTRAMIIEHVWNLTFDSTTNVVDVYINYLRRKVDDGFSPSLIHTVRGVGYKMNPNGASAGARLRLCSRNQYKVRMYSENCCTP